MGQQTNTPSLPRNLFDNGWSPEGCVEYCHQWQCPHHHGAQYPQPINCKALGVDHHDKPRCGHMDHLAVLARGLDTAAHLTTAMISVTMLNIIESIMPEYALAKVHHYLRREYCKPANMRVQDYFQRLVFINTQGRSYRPSQASPDMLDNDVTQ
jgi:hypothetical protein